ncbi:MAG: SusD/RagB family nutrient-binding outer membrane lipoprotein [Chitinophagaceae bacterium]|nr:MAG: SusD/RagB family nutrient-binding outer membrane lipoprotein [Chitinophagaceae bacterium]
MNKLLIKTGLFFMAGTFLLASCNKFDQINTNPNATVTANASLLATDIILQNLQYQGRDAKAYLSDNAASQYIAYGNESMISAQYGDLGSTDFTPMTLIPNANSMLSYAATTGTQMDNSYKGLAKFSEAFMFYYLTMEVGDIPFSQVGEGGSGNIRPAYDLQEQVFKGILNDLQEADEDFANGTQFAGDPSPYNGNPDKWRRATNSFALKVLISLSNKVNDTALNVESRFAAIVNEGELLQPATGFLGLEYSTVDPHPLSGTNDLFTSRTAISTLVMGNLKALNDRRLFYFADPAPSKITAGLSPSDTAAYVGANVTDSYDDVTNNLLNNVYSLLNSRYLAVQAGDPRIMVSYGEQQLILAEARILGWITTGTAQDYYQTGVTAILQRYLSVDASYVHGMPITQSYINNYFTGDAAFAPDPTDELHQIWIQRYLSEFMQDPISAFFMERRTGYPVFPVNPATSLNITDKNAVPVRWLYPGSELNYNKQNLITALNRQYGGVDDMNAKMWLLK